MPKTSCACSQAISFRDFTKVWGGVWIGLSSWLMMGLFSLETPISSPFELMAYVIK
jgi:hypothetical protein